MKRCPYCSKEISDNVIRCNYCRKYISGQTKQIDQPWSFKDIGVIFILFVIIYYPLFFLFSFIFYRLGFDKNTIVLLSGSIQLVLLTFLIYLNTTQGYHRSFLKSLSIKLPKNFNLTYTLFIALGLFLLFKLFPRASNVPKFTYLLQIRFNFIIFAFSTIAIAPISEEILFRGYIFPVIKEKYGILCCVVSIIILSTLWHIFFVGLIWNLLFKLLIVSSVLTLLRAITESTLPSILVHFFYNFLTIIVMIF